MGGGGGEVFVLRFPVSAVIMGMKDIVISENPTVAYEYESRPAVKAVWTQASALL